MSEQESKNPFELFIKEIQSFLTFGYLILIGIGMIFNYCKYAEFGINIFQYADVFDFLIEPFSDIVILGFTFISFVLTLILHNLDATWKKHKPESYSKYNLGWDKKKWFTAYRIVLSIITFSLYVFLAASSYGEYAKQRIDKTSEISIKYADNEVVRGKFIGKTQDEIFLLKDGKVQVIPYNSVVKVINLN